MTPWGRVMMDVDKLEKSIRQAPWQWNRESASTTMTESAPLQQERTVGKTIPEGFYNVKVRMEQAPARQAPKVRAEELNLSSEKSHISTQACGNQLSSASV